MDSKKKSIKSCRISFSDNKISLQRWVDLLFGLRGVAGRLRRNELQLCSVNVILLPLFLCKWGHFERAKTTLKMLLASWFLVCFFRRLRSFNDKNLGSVGQRAAKLPAIKLWEWLGRDRESNPGRLADWGRGRLADFSGDLQLWQLVPLRSFDLQTSYHQYKRSKPFEEVYQVSIH